MNAGISCAANRACYWRRRRGAPGGRAPHRAAVTRSLRPAACRELLAGPAGLACAVFASAATIAPVHADEILFRELLDIGLTYEQTGSAFGACVAAGDYDGDGWTDLVLVGGRPAGMRLYRNNGDRSFTDVTADTIPPGLPWASGVLMLDFDNDGDQDIVYAREANNRSWTGFGWLRNEGGVYVIGLADDTFARGNGRLGGMAAADLDGDGLLDVMKGHYFGQGFLLMGTPAGGFVDETPLRCPTMLSEKTNWAVALADFNNDGFTDIHLAIDFYEDVQYRNLGNGEFIDVSIEANVLHAGSDMGLAVGDIDNDGDLDIFSSNMRPHVLYVNDGSGRFTDEAAARGIAADSPFIGSGWGTAFADFDLDGDLDLVMADSGVPGLLYANDGTGYFTDVSDGCGSGLHGYGLALLDLENDGDPDVVITDSVNLPIVLENISPGNGGRNWLMVRPRGSYSNRDGIGARVWVSAGGVRQMREIHRGSSFKGISSREAHFGLGDAPVAGSVQVWWPSGMVLRLADVPANQLLTVVEPNPDLTGDGYVDLADLQELLSHFGSSGDGIAGDFDGNGTVELSDLSALLTVYTHLN